MLTAKKLAIIFLPAMFFLSACSSIGTSKPAALQITSNSEAAVFLDGKHLGKTPYFSDQLKNGTYTLKIAASDASYVEKITLTSGTLTVVNRTLAASLSGQSGEVLTLDPGSKGVFIASLPESADVTIDGKYAGKTPLLTTKIDEGDHKVEISKTSYEKRAFAIKTSKKYQLNAEVTLASGTDLNQAGEQSALSSIKKVEVQKTPQGFLRVRQEPTLDATEIGRAQTGEQYEVITENQDWTRIKFQGKNGWVSNEFIKKI